MRKVYQLDPHFATGEATVQPVLLWGRNGRPLRERFSKTASEASDYIQSVEPKPGTSIVLVLALGAYETYDLNRNGDGFNEHAYRVGVKPTCGCCSAPGGWVAQDEVLPQHYQSFEQFGKIYRHHQNKDPQKACGDVLKAFWNPQMHRVELLLGLKNELAPDLAQRIADGEYPPVSMGCRIKYDVCTICGHRAPTRAKYCDHLKMSMRQVTPSGLRAGALNPAPRFFDISWVVKPADQTGFMLKKVAEDGAYELKSSAELGEILERAEAKKAALQKLSDIDKVIRGVPVDHKVSPLSEAEARQVQRYQSLVRPAVQQMPTMDKATIGQLAQHPMKDVLSTLSAAGVILTTPEFLRLIVEKLAPGTQLSEQVLDAAVAMQGQVFDLFAKEPKVLETLQGTGMFDISAKNVKPEIGGIAERYLEKRSTIGDYLSRALIPRQLREEEPPWTDTLHVVDGSTGDRFETTRGAARDAHDQIAKAQLAKIIGGGLLLGGAYKALATDLGPFKPLALGGALLAGHRYLQPDYGAQYSTEEGVDIPTLTEMRKVSGELSNVGMPLLGSAALITALGHDYESRLMRGEPVHDPEAPLHQRLYDQLGRFYAEHPTLGFMGNLAAYGLGANLFNKFSAYLGDLFIGSPTDSVTLPDVDLDRLALKLGSVVIG